MRRLLAVGALVAVCAIATVVLSTGVGGAGDYRVNAVFDDARGLVPGQLVKIAGARVGRIVGVSLTEAQQARVEMRVSSRFAPFHEDAGCTIRPEGLIAENYVECNPGSDSAPPLGGPASGVPTVSVSHNSEPVSLTDLFNIFDTPTRDRFAVIVDELGIGTAGRGSDINAIVRRAAPTLNLTRRVLDIVDRQRAQLQTVITASDRLIGRLAADPRRVAEFIASAAAVGGQIAAHRDALSQTVQRLPALLREAHPALRRLDQLAVRGRTLLDALSGATVLGINRLSKGVVELGRAAPVASRQLGLALDRGTAASRKLVPVVTVLRDYAQASLPRAQLSGRLYTDLRSKGFVESLLSLFYYGAAGAARFDGVSHILPAHLLVTNCQTYATTPAAGCSANYVTRRTGVVRAPRGARTTAKLPALTVSPPAVGPVDGPGSRPGLAHHHRPGSGSSLLPKQVGDAVAGAEPQRVPGAVPLNEVLGYLLG